MAHYDGLRATIAAVAKLSVSDGGGKARFIDWHPYNGDQAAREPRSCVGAERAPQRGWAILTQQSAETNELQLANSGGRNNELHKVLPSDLGGTHHFRVFGRRTGTVARL
jgi:hypothetical protein